jgi:hypothetical protein
MVCINRYCKLEALPPFPVLKLLSPDGSGMHLEMVLCADHRDALGTMMRERAAIARELEEFVDITDG